MTTALELAIAFGYLTEREVLALQGLVNQLPDPALALNVGAGSGTSALAMAEANPALIIWTVDYSEGGPLGGLDNERNAFRNSSLTMMPWRWSRLILGDSRQLANDWKKLGGPLFDFIFIDDGHLEHEIRGDIEGWLPLLKQGGIMAFHDYTRKAWPDVKVVVDELMSSYEMLWHVDTLIAFRV